MSLTEQLPLPLDRAVYDPKAEAAEFERGACPRCRATLVSRCWYVDGRGYLVAWCCTGNACDYRRVL